MERKAGERESKSAGDKQGPRGGWVKPCRLLSSAFMWQPGPLGRWQLGPALLLSCLLVPLHGEKQDTFPQSTGGALSDEASTASDQPPKVQLASSASAVHTCGVRSHPPEPGSSAISGQRARWHQSSRAFW